MMPRRIAVLFGATASVLMFHRLLLLPPVGMPREASWRGEPAYSSQLLLSGLGESPTQALDWLPALAILAPGVACCTIFGALVAWFVALLPGRTLFRAMLAGLLTLVVSDRIFVGFFMSPSGESAALLGIFALGVALLNYWSGRSPMWLSLPVVVLVAGFAIPAKPQMVSWLPAIAFAVFWLPRGTPSRSICRRWSALVLPAAALAIIAAFTGTILSERINPGSNFLFYASHPASLIGLGERGISVLLSPEPGSGAGHVPGFGAPLVEGIGGLSLVFALYTAMKAAPVVLLGFHLLTLLLGFAVAARTGSAVGRLAVVLVLGCWAQFWVVMMSEGGRGIQHELIVAGFTSALCLPLLLASVSILASKSVRHGGRTYRRAGNHAVSPTSRPFGAGPAS
ncbi:hypothetical protein AB6813_07770 [bacterium RCC_150]